MSQIILIVNHLIFTATYEMLHSCRITAILSEDDIINPLPVQFVTSFATVDARNNRQGMEPRPHT